MAIKFDGVHWAIWIGGKLYRGSLRSCAEAARIEFNVRCALPMSPRQRWALERPYGGTR